MAVRITALSIMQPNLTTLSIMSLGEMTFNTAVLRKNKIVYFNTQRLVLMILSIIVMTIMTLSKMTLSKMTLSKMTLSKMTLSKMTNITK